MPEIRQRILENMQNSPWAMTTLSLKGRELGASPETCVQYAAIWYLFSATGSFQISELL